MGIRVCESVEVVGLLESLHSRDRRSKGVSLKRGGAVLESLLCLGGIQVSAVCIDVEHRHQAHFSHPYFLLSC